MGKKKEFDCVVMKHKGAEKVQAEIREMTREQELAYWAEGTNKVREEKERLLRKDGATTS
jgi:hypothetical protein